MDDGGFSTKNHMVAAYTHTRGSKSHFGETSDILATFHFESHGHGVVTMEKPNSSHLGNFNSYLY